MDFGRILSGFDKGFDDEDEKASIEPPNETNPQSLIIPGFRKRRRTETETEPKAINENRTEPPRKIRKINHRKDTGRTAIEHHFMDLNQDKQKMLLNNVNNAYWNTMCESVGICGDINVKYLKDTLDLYCDANASHQDISNALDPAASFVSSKIGRLWKKGENSMYLIGKRLLLIELDRYKDHCGRIGDICRTYKTVIQHIQAISNALDTQTMKKRNSKVLSIKETMEKITSTSNQWRDMNKLCDDILVLKTKLAGFIAILIECEATLDNTLECDLKIMRKNITLSGTQRVNVKNKRTVFGASTFKAPGVYRSVMRVLNIVISMKTELQQKLNVMNSIKMDDNILESRQNEVQKARDKDNKRKRISDEISNDEMTEYDYRKKDVNGEDEADDVNSDDNTVVAQMMVTRE